MPRPVALCLEYPPLPDGRERYLQCVALPGDQRGAALDRTGTLIWEGDPDQHLRLAVSTDERLVLLRSERATEVTLHRGRRSLDVPAGKPVVLLHGDELQLQDLRIRLHVHGPTRQVAPPCWLAPVRPAAVAAPSARGGWAAAALALGAALGAGACKGKPDAPPPRKDAQEEIEVREQPPMVPIEHHRRDDMPPPMADLPDAAVPAVPGDAGPVRRGGARH